MPFNKVVTRSGKVIYGKKGARRAPPKVSKAVKRFVKKEVQFGGDKQYHDFTNASGTAMSTSIGNGGGVTNPIVYELTRISSGSGIENKEGSELNMTGVRIKGILSQAAIQESNIVRCVVFSLKDPPVYGSRTFTNLANKLWGSTSTTADWLYNPFIPAESKIYWDKTWLFEGAQDTTLVQKRLVDKWLPIKKKIIYTKDSATLGASEARNPLFILWISDSSVVPNPGFEGGLVRVYYRDQ